MIETYDILNGGPPPSLQPVAVAREREGQAYKTSSPERDRDRGHGGMPTMPRDAQRNVAR